MERVLSWLNQPLFPDTVIRVWMAVAAGAALLLALILAFFLIRRKKKKKACRALTKAIIRTSEGSTRNIKNLFLEKSKDKRKKRRQKNHESHHTDVTGG